MAKIIAVANQKGGVGKTTSTVNLAAALGMRNKKILLCDLDPQGNSTSGLGVSRNDDVASAYDVLIEDSDITEAIIDTKFKNLALLPSHIDLAGAELEIQSKPQREKLLINALQKVKDKYDFIFIDCPPALGLITINALSAADTVLIPIQCEFYALEGLSQLVTTVRQMKRMYNPELEIEGVLLTMFDKRLKLNDQVSNEVKKYFPDKVYKTMIPRSVRLSEAPGFGMPAVYYDPHNKGSKAYINLAKEFLKANKNGGFNKNSANDEPDETPEEAAETVTQNNQPTEQPKEKE